MAFKSSGCLPANHLQNRAGSFIPQNKYLCAPYKRLFLLCALIVFVHFFVLVSFYEVCFAKSSLAPIDIDDLVLVNKLEDVWSVHEDAHSAYSRNQKEYPELGSVHHHRHKFPVFSYLNKIKRKIKSCISQIVLSTKIFQ